MLGNAAALLDILQSANVQLVFTGHLHVQDIAYRQGLFDITTGSLVSYPHPYRVIHLQQDAMGNTHLQVESHRVKSVPDWSNLQQASREWMGDRSLPFMAYMLTQPPLNLGQREALRIAPKLKYFWAAIAAGDPEFDFPDFPDSLREHFESFSHRHSQEIQLNLKDNHFCCQLQNT